MKIIVTKEELLDLCARCTELASSSADCEENCIFGYICKEAYLDFLLNNTEVKENEQRKYD